MGLRFLVLLDLVLVVLLDGRFRLVLADLRLDAVLRFVLPLRFVLDTLCLRLLLEREIFCALEADRVALPSRLPNFTLFLFVAVFLFFSFLCLDRLDA